MRIIIEKTLKAYKTKENETAIGHYGDRKPHAINAAINLPIPLPTQPLLKNNRIDKINTEKRVWYLLKLVLEDWE